MWSLTVQDTEIGSPDTAVAGTDTLSTCRSVGGGVSISIGTGLTML